MQVASKLVSGSLFVAFLFCPLSAQIQKTASVVTFDISKTGYKVVKKFKVPGEGGWDAIAVDGSARRVYVSHGDQIQVLNADSGKLLGQIAAPGAHGVALALELRRGFTSNGADSSVTIFSTDTLAVIKTVHVETGTDDILYDPFTKRVFPLSEKITVLDANTGSVAGTVDLGARPEAAVTDAEGTLYVNEVDKNLIAVIDTRTLTITRTYPLRNCRRPHSLSYDALNQRLFVGCVNDVLSVLDATTGRTVGISGICTGLDGGGFDLEARLIFVSCAEGVISVVRQTTPDYYELIDTVSTQLFANTMAFDDKTKNIYVPAAEYQSTVNVFTKQPITREIKPGSFAILVVSKK